MTLLDGYHYYEMVLNAAESLRVDPFPTDPFLNSAQCHGNLYTVDIWLRHNANESFMLGSLALVLQADHELVAHLEFHW